MHTVLYTPSVVLFLIVIDYIPWYMTCTVSKSVHTYIHNTYMTYAYLCTYYITKVRCSATVHEASHTCMSCIDYNIEIEKLHKKSQIVKQTKNILYSTHTLLSLLAAVVVTTSVGLKCVALDPAPILQLELLNSHQ